MDGKLVGVTLLFASRTSDRLEGWLKCYVVHADSQEQLVAAADRLGRAQELRDSEQGEEVVTYVGIEDVFSVAGPLEHGAMLGRSTSWQLYSKEAAQTLVQRTDQFTLRRKLVRHTGKWYLATPVYFADDANDSDLRRTISCYALIECNDSNAVLARSIAVADSDTFRQKIASCDVERLPTDSLVFLGFEDITVIDEDITQGGAFLYLVREFETMRQIRSLRIKAKRFKDRAEGGKLLAKELSKYTHRKDILILGLPAGGVPVGFEVANALHAPLDVLLVHDLGIPGHEELSLGAIATGSVRILNHGVVEAMNIPVEVIEAVSAREHLELKRRELAYRGNASGPDVRGKTVILVDDGIDTGATMLVAVAALKKQQPARIVVASPTAPTSSCDKLQAEVDELVVISKPNPFYSVDLAYDVFGQISDAEVRELLRRSRVRQG